MPTDNTCEMTQAVNRVIDSIFIAGVRFYRCGVGLLELVSDKYRQTDLFATPDNPELMNTMDKLNSRYGDGTVFLAAQGTKHDWQMKREFLSPRYTSRFKDLPKIQC